MRPVFFGVVLALLVTSQAQALCISRPDNAASDYVHNGAAQTMCLQSELYDTTRRLDQKTRIDLRDSALRLDLQRKIELLPPSLPVIR